jgi:hypothetical protein
VFNEYSRLDGVGVLLGKGARARENDNGVPQWACSKKQKGTQNRKEKVTLHITVVGLDEVYRKEGTPLYSVVGIALWLLSAVEQQQHSSRYNRTSIGSFCCPCSTAVLRRPLCLSSRRATEEVSEDGERFGARHPNSGLGSGAAFCCHGFDRCAAPFRGQAHENYSKSGR